MNRTALLCAERRVTGLPKANWQPRDADRFLVAAVGGTRLRLEGINSSETEWRPNGPKFPPVRQYQRLQRPALERVP